MRRQIAIERQAVEVRRGQGAQIHGGRSRQIASPQPRSRSTRLGIRSSAREGFFRKRAAQRQQSVLALEYHGAVKGPERLRNASPAAAATPA